MEVGGEVAYISIPSFGCPRAHVLTPTAIAAGSVRLTTIGVVNHEEQRRILHKPAWRGSTRFH